MVKEPKDIDLTTSGRQLSEKDFARISAWIKKQKESASRKKKTEPSENISHNTGLSDMGASE